MSKWKVPHWKSVDPTAFVETYRSNVRVAGNIESYRLDTVVIRSFPASHLLRCSVL